MPVTKKDVSGLKYMNGFGNHFQSEAVPDSLPKLGNNPQKGPHGLYTECISGTAFTVPRHLNQRSWVYRLRPAVQHLPFEPYEGNKKLLSSFHPFSPDIEPTPQQLRWDPLTFEGAKDADFVDGIVTLGGAGDTQLKDGLGIHFYNFSKDMGNKSFYNSDGDFLIVPVKGEILITTEFGKLHVPPLHIAVVQRGLKMTVDRVDPDPNDCAQGFICELYKGHFQLPELGPIGSNGLANAKDFEVPVAAYEDKEGEYTVVNKFVGKMFSYKQDHSPYDIVSYSGNYIPFRYDLTKFNTIGTISYDHPDPSIYTVLTAPTGDQPGTAVIDFVIFPPRWLVAENTFRPPWFHRNVMAEFMGNIEGVYDAKAEGFMPGGASLHNMNTAHGPDAETFNKATNAELKPHKVSEGSMAFMFESAYQIVTTKWSIQESGKIQQDYWKAWQGLEKISDL
ncbi:hypothetical protein CspeluHIS016_0403530 [Cutaneotrichosporon spelunceum]|uniref:homogentisate 1,2-dioxygenase n=1 Tax=Cutaneotrichosporon spelunceum TaxID=1672016 RepID=A0AAD3YD45_9TREE|nr:hypothetical protein CspeluHIS016_0403530 [Cutaneotrichosporon spelunceum]